MPKFRLFRDRHVAIRNFYKANTDSGRVVLNYVRVGNHISLHAAVPDNEKFQPIIKAFGGQWRVGVQAWSFRGQDLKVIRGACAVLFGEDRIVEIRNNRVRVENLME